MTLDQIVATVAARLNLTSTVALARIADDVRERYADVLGTVGLATSSRGVATGATVVGSRYVTFYGAHKLMSVYNSTGETLDERTFDELRNDTPVPGSGSPSLYAVATMGPSYVQIFTDTQAAVIETLSADAILDLTALGGSDEPVFPSLFHDVLTHGAMADELLKMEKPGLAELEEGKYQKRLSELRYFIAKSAYLKLYQGRTSWGFPWWPR